MAKTLIIGYAPLTDLAGRKNRELRDDRYVKDLIAEYNLGEVHFASYSNYKEAIDSLNPFVIIVFGEYYAQEIKEHKKDVFLFVADSPGVIFHKKAEANAKQEKQREIFRQAAWVIQKVKADGPKKESTIREIAAMGYKETYNMLIKMITSDREDLRQQAWALLTDNNGGSDFLWMRVQLVCEVWNHGDGKRKEEFLCMAMDQHIDNGLVHQMDNFTDSDGQSYHQYMFHYLDGSDANYIRRIPVGCSGQDKYAYQSLLDKYETPNGPAMMLEAGQFKKELEEYLKRQNSQQCYEGVDSSS